MQIHTHTHAVCCVPAATYGSSWGICAMFRALGGASPFFSTLASSTSADPILKRLGLSHDCADPIFKHFGLRNKC